MRSLVKGYIPVILRLDRRIQFASLDCPIKSGNDELFSLIYALLSKGFQIPSFRILLKIPYFFYDFLCNLKGSFIFSIDHHISFFVKWLPEI